MLKQIGVRDFCQQRAIDKNQGIQDARQGLNMAGTYLLEMIILFLYKFKTASQWEQSFNSCRRQGGKRIFAVTFLFSPPAHRRFNRYIRKYNLLSLCHVPQHCGGLFSLSEIFKLLTCVAPAIQGRWHVVTEGLKNICNRGNVSRHQPLPLPCPVVLWGVLSCKIQGRCPQGRRGQKIPATVVTELNLTSQKSYAPFPPLPIPLTQHRGKE